MQKFTIEKYRFKSHYALVRLIHSRRDKNFASLLRTLLKNTNADASLKIPNYYTVFLWIMVLFLSSSRSSNGLANRLPIQTYVTANLFDIY